MPKTIGWHVTGVLLLVHELTCELWAILHFLFFILSRFLFYPFFHLLKPQHTIHQINMQT